jgi:hypothetical protein
MPVLGSSKVQIGIVICMVFHQAYLSLSTELALSHIIAISDSNFPLIAGEAPLVYLMFITFQYLNYRQKAVY